MGSQSEGSVVLLSGGLDSAVCLHLSMEAGLACDALYIDYGQPASTAERRASQALAKHFGVRWAEVGVRFSRHLHSGFVPYRNGLLLALALVSKLPPPATVTIGIHSGTEYIDSTERFVDAFQQVLDVSFEGSVVVSAPLLHWSKSSIVDYALQVGFPIQLTWSCEEGLEHPCGSCLSCLDRKMIA